MDFSRANTYITSQKVAELNISGEDVHANLWPLFQQLLSSSTPETATKGWNYANSFAYALDSVKSEQHHQIKNSDILETKNYQLRLGFFFIMHIHH